MSKNSTGWTVSDDSPLIAFAGDWHGHDSLVPEKLFRLADLGVSRLHHVGDFGFQTDSRGTEFLDRVDGWAAEASIRIAVTPGNHENWEYLRAAFDRASPGTPAEIRSHITALPRGYRWTQSNRILMSFGGAASIDRSWRIPGVSWWPEELPTEDEIVAAITGGTVDVMISHDSPNPATSKVAAIRRTPGSWGPAAIAYAKVGAAVTTRVWEAAHPQLLVHGHFHVRDAIQLGSGQKIVSLAKQTDIGNVIVVDLADLSGMWLEGFDA
jgi:hypothetical protein